MMVREMGTTLPKETGLHKTKVEEEG